MSLLSLSSIFESNLQKTGGNQNESLFPSRTIPEKLTEAKELSGEVSDVRLET